MKIICAIFGVIFGLTGLSCFYNLAIGRHPSPPLGMFLLGVFSLAITVLCVWGFKRSADKGKKIGRSIIAKTRIIDAHGKTPTVTPVGLSYIDKMEGHEFEQFTAGLLRKLGYERVEVTPGSGDQGVDVIAVKDGKRYAIQCKRYSQKLGNKPVQEVFAGKTIYGCSIAVVLTNNYFTEGAKEAARATGVELWDRDTLRRMMDYANFRALV